MSGVSPKITSTSYGARAIAVFAASTACAVPRRSACTKISASGSTRLASAATASAPSPTTSAVMVPPALRTDSSTWARSDWPAIACSTFGRVESMRVPSPAASTMARQVRSTANGPPPRGALRPPAPSYPSAPRRKRWNARGGPVNKRPDWRGSAVSRLRRLIRGQGAGRGSRRGPRELWVVRQGCAPHSTMIMQSQLFLPTARQTNWLLLLALLSLGEALYLRYLAIEYAQVSLACQAGLDTWLCTTFRLVIVLYNYSAFGWIALGAALLNLLRPSILLVAVALAATAFGLVLHNANLAGVAAALLMLSLARPAPVAE